MKLKNKEVQKSIATKKDFSYSKETCGLNFTLNVDSPKELQSFRECLMTAIKDIDVVLSTFK